MVRIDPSVAESESSAERCNLSQTGALFTTVLSSRVSRARVTALRVTVRVSRVSVMV